MENLAKCSKVLCYIVFFFGYVMARKENIQLHFLRIQDCDISPERYDPNNVVSHHMQVVVKNNVSVVRGNFTVLKKTLPISVNVRVYKIVNEKKELLLKSEHLACANPMVKLGVKTMFSLNDDCTLNPSVKTVNGFSMSKVKSSNLFDLAAGLYVMDFEIVTANGVIFCSSTYIRASKKMKD